MSTEDKKRADIGVLLQRLVSRHGVPIGQVSDGYHTFDELYEHRCALFLALMASHPSLSWVSRKHHDGSEWAGWFIAGIKAPTGDTTYHLPESMWPLAVNTGAAVLETGMWWDGHTPAQVADRIRVWAEVMAANAPVRDGLNKQQTSNE